MARVHLHPDIKRFVTKALHAVDKFHFVHNHKGAWCDAFVNPYKVEELNGVNTEVCEQTFRCVVSYVGWAMRGCLYNTINHLYVLQKKKRQVSHLLICTGWHATL